LGALVGDFDGDGRPEVYVANDSTPNFLWRRRADGRYEDVAVPAGCALSEDGRTEAGMAASPRAT
jgi:outer membrane protein assembly factor BamB